MKVVLVTNCQGWPLSKIIKALNPEVNITAIATVYSLRSDQYHEYKDALDEADVIISMLVFDSYPCEFARTNFLKSHYGNKVISVVNLYFTGYNPDWFYIRTNGMGPLRGPMGDYHNRTIFESWQNGEDLSTAAEQMQSTAYNKKYLPEIENSLQVLRGREELVDVKITDFIEENFTKERLFFTFNHPSMSLLAEYAKRIMEKANIPIINYDGALHMRELLNKFVPLVNPAMGLPSGEDMEDKHAGVEFSIDIEKLVTIGNKKLYETKEIVESYYKIYDQLSERLDLKNYRN